MGTEQRPERPVPGKPKPVHNITEATIFAIPRIGTLVRAKTLFEQQRDVTKPEKGTRQFIKSRWNWIGWEEHHDSDIFRR